MSIKSKDTFEKIDSIILGAGKPNYGVIPPALKTINKKKNLLNWQVKILKQFSKNITFISGYKSKMFRGKRSDLDFIHNDDWNEQNVVGSFLKYNFTKVSTLISYSDIIYRNEIIRKIFEKNYDIVIGVDSKWEKRFEARSKADKDKAELFEINKIIKISKFNSCTDNQYEFIGVVKFSKKVIIFIINNKKNISVKWSIPELIIFLQTNGFKVMYEDCPNKWAELNAPQDLSRFILGTKSETLKRLQTMVKKSVVQDQVSFSVYKWSKNKRECLLEIERKFKNKVLIIRSSSLNEDGFNNSNAGKYLSIPFVNQSEENKLVNAISRVVQSFNDKNVDNQILIQVMIENSRISGVITSRTLSFGTPFRVINYDDETRRTDTVTSGNFGNTKTLFVLKNKKMNKENFFFNKLLGAIEEIERIISNDSLDIEFIINEKYKIIILQVRPIAVDHSKWLGWDQKFFNYIKKSKKKYKTILANNKKGLPEIFSNMQDWNPAEIIGRNPRNLALSIYENIITNKVWAIQRSEFGYKKVDSPKLIESFCGKPYINCSKSFESLIPKAMSEKLSRKLLAFYLEKLKNNSELHDKVEFEIAFTCFEFNFLERARELKSHGFSDKDIEEIQNHLIKITQNAFESINKNFLPLKKIDSLLLTIKKSQNNDLKKAFLTLEICRKFGSLPFAHLARHGFISILLLNSSTKSGIITDKERDDYLLNINTIAKQLKKDMDDLLSGIGNSQRFIKKYGHLRPGTYEITTPSYRENISEFIKTKKKKQTSEGNKDTVNDNKVLKCMHISLKKSGVNVKFVVLKSYLKKSIEGREMSKFIFTKCVSESLDYLTSFANKNNFNLNLFSHLKLADLEKFKNLKIKENDITKLKKIAIKNEEIHKLSCGSELPPVIKKLEDFDYFNYPNTIPNFITSKKIRAESVILDNLEKEKKIGKKIIIIENADPGYDWIFSHKISGLITLYGGVNSHMAIRSAEFGLPAAIGVGETIYERLKKFKIIFLDCVNKKIEGII